MMILFIVVVDMVKQEFVFKSAESMLERVIVRKDSEAQSAIQEYQTNQASLKASLMLNAVSEDDRQALQKPQETKPYKITS